MTELFTQVDAVLAKLVQYCIDHNIGYSYSMNMDGLTWHMRTTNPSCRLKVSLYREEIRAQSPDRIVRTVLAAWELEKLKR